MDTSTIIDNVDYGPLASLVGTWKGDGGMDVSPEPDGKEESPYYETILFEAIGDVTNAEIQTLSVLRYHQVVSRKLDNQVFHNETGYWMWDAKTNIIMQSLTIPRGVSLLAGGLSKIDKQDQSISIEVCASEGDPEWGIVQSPFMKEKAKTVKFNHCIGVMGDEIKYTETTVLEIYGKTFDHTDSNKLKRV